VKVRGPSWSPVGEVLATASSRRTIRRARRGRGGHAIVRRAASNDGLAHLRLADDSIVPTLADVKEWLDAVCADPSIETVRTSALFPRSAERFAEAGFTVADTLSLLRADLASPPIRAALAGPVGDDQAATVTLRHRDYAEAARVDRAAFGPTWGHDADELKEIRNATPLHRARGRVGRGGMLRRAIDAFAVAGASSEHGYLQRLSVDPVRQRHGHGRRLTVDALQWMVRRNLPDCLVNTSVNNTAALALYDSVGFVPVRDRLQVLQFAVRSPA